MLSAFAVRSLKTLASQHRPRSNPEVAQWRRALSTDTTPTKSGNDAKAGGAGIFQRVNSFLLGAGITAIISQYYLYEQIKEGNKLMILKQKELEVRLLKLEKKK